MNTADKLIEAGKLAVLLTAICKSDKITLPKPGYIAVEDISNLMEMTATLLYKKEFQANPLSLLEALSKANDIKDGHLTEILETLEKECDCPACQTRKEKSVEKDSSKVELEEAAEAAKKIFGMEDETKVKEVNPLEMFAQILKDMTKGPAGPSIRNQMAQEDK